MTKGTKKLEKYTKAELINFIESIPASSNKINSYLEMLKNQKDNISYLVNEIRKCYGNIFNTQEKTDDNPNGLSVKHNLENLQKNSENLQKEWKEKYNALKMEIESHLPGAASAGLSSSFREGKEENIKSGWLLFGFIGPLLLLLLFYGYSFVYQDISEITITTIIVKSSLGAPLIWIAWFCQKTIAEQKIIREEYHHKQRIMSLYDGFIKHIQSTEMKEDTQAAKLTKVMLDAIKVNPANNLNKNSSNNQFSEILKILKNTSKK